MGNEPGTQTRTPRNIPPFSGWNAINHTRYPSSPDPTPEPTYLAQQSSESPFWKTPQPTNPTTPASEGLKRTGAWLESMAKRRQAAQATVMRSSESLEPRSAKVASTRSLHSNLFEGSNCTSPMKSRETRIIPTTTPRLMEGYPFPFRTISTPQRNVQVVIPFNPRIAPSPASGVMSRSHAPIKVSRSTQSPVSTVGSLHSTERLEIDDSCASSVDSVDSEEEEVYDVERILDERRVSGEVQFLIQWVNYAELNWVSDGDCFCEDLIEDFRTTRISRLRSSGPSHARQHAPESAECRRLRAQRRAETLKKTPQIQLPRTSKRPVKTPRDPKTGKFQRKSATTLGPSSNDCVGRETASVAKAAIVPSKNVRTNTARFSPRVSAPGVVYIRRNETTGEIDWLRSAREVDLGASLDVRDKNTMGGERSKVEQAKHIKGRSRQREDSYAQQRPSANGEREKGRQTHDSQPSERPTYRQGEPYNSFVVEPSTINTNWQNAPQKRGPIHIRFDDDVPTERTPITDPVRHTGSVSTKRRASCGDMLRRARTQEKKSGGPSLLRHEFSSYMSQKHAEALINQTRASPERAFGFSLPCNSVLLSIEKDDD